MFIEGLEKVAVSFVTSSALKRIKDAKRRGIKQPDKRLGLITMKIASHKKQDSAQRRHWMKNVAISSDAPGRLLKRVHKVFKS